MLSYIIALASTVPIVIDPFIPRRSAFDSLGMAISRIDLLVWMGIMVFILGLLTFITSDHGRLDLNVAGGVVFMGAGVGLMGYGLW